MYLKQLTIKNFRAIDYLKISFNKDLNIIVGENNSGKSAVIDALRICLTYGDQWKDIFLKRSDFYIDRNLVDIETPNIEFDLIFKIENEIEEGYFYDLLAIDDNRDKNLQLHFKYFIEYKNGVERIKHRVWGGEIEGQTVPPEVLELIYSVYLGALRDAEKNLRPTRGNRLGELFSNLTSDEEGNFIDEEKRDELAGKVLSSLNEDQEWINLIQSGKSKINEHLLATSINGKEQTVEIDFFPYNFRKIVDNLRVQIPLYDAATLDGNSHKQRFLEISQNGLGSNNLIFTAAILGDLKNKKNVDPEGYNALLVEEPEAHLHPQLQNILFSYINQLKGDEMQLFITSHSPTITAKAELDSMIVLNNQDYKIHALSLKNSNLNDINKKYLSKFLDVTKSQLLFSNGILLVEGISESLLMDQFSKMIANGEYDLEKKGVEIVNINGVAFEHFGNLFNSSEIEKRLNIRCAILTDDDRTPESDEVSSRASNAMDLEGGMLKVHLAKVTFEYEIFTASAENAELLFELFNEIHPRAGQRISRGNSLKEFGDNFLEKLEKNKAKSELAHRLVITLIEDEVKRENFTIPSYIEEAIKWVVAGD